MSALDLFTVLSAPAANGGGSGASAGADADAAGVFAGLLAMHAPASAPADARIGQQATAGAETTTQGFEDPAQVFILPSPFAPAPTNTDVAAGPLLAIQGQLLNSGQTPGETPAETLSETPAGGFTSLGGGMESEAGQDGSKAAIPSALAGADRPAPLQTSPSASGLAPAASLPESPPSSASSASLLPAAAAESATASGNTAAAVKTGSLAGPATEASGVPAPSATPPVTPARASLTPVLAAASTPASPDELTGKLPATGTADTGAAPTSALQKPSSGMVEAIQVAARGAGAVPPGEPGRMMQAQRGLTDEAGRRSDRREPFMNPLLATASETGDAPRPPSGAHQASGFSPVLQPGSLNMAHAQAQAAQPGQIKPEITPPAVDAALPQGEGEAARTLDTAASAPLPSRDGLPSGLSRATIETTALMAAQIVRRLEGRSTRFEMALTPEGLGRVNVSMEIDSDGQLAARLAFDNPAAAAELRGRVDDLRRQLEASGFRIGEDALEFTDRETARDHGADNPFDRRPGRAFAGAGQLIDDAPAPPPPPRWAALALTPEGVDMKV